MTIAIEATGHLDADPCLHCDAPLPISGPSRVRVILLIEEDDEVSERLWLKAAASSDVYDFLDDPAADLYSFEDGTLVDAEA